MLAPYPATAHAPSRGLAFLEHLLRIEHSEQLDQLCHHSCPSCLVARPEPRPAIPMEVLVEEDLVPPVRIALELLRAPVDRPPAVRIAQEDAREPVRDLL